MPYVQRDEQGNIIGVYANLQPGYAEEFLPDDDQDLLAYLSPPPPPYTIDADIPWLRMTDDEAVLVQDGIDASPVKTRNIINKATSFIEGTETFIKFKAIIAAATDHGRADTIMGPLTIEELSSAALEVQ
ncbi:hypothetical protein [Rhizobium leguminosarum]|uniref:hypothetical protein n=1 Tax=Rhizobium leguminosarum TaxID=384 RepID=UPI001C94B82D|nr:hypothetical protein [Rhizobium leguminosarum]MBY5698515.1 hypothetical protein [Rhizobium leguminosarum]